LGPLKATIRKLVMEEAKPTIAPTIETPATTPTIVPSSVPATVATAPRVTVFLTVLLEDWEGGSSMKQASLWSSPS
jgi:hypothetical protein